MSEMQQPLNEQLQNLMDRLILASLCVTALAMALVILLGAG
jgi:hypothetical protein